MRDHLPECPRVQERGKTYQFADGCQCRRLNQAITRTLNEAVEELSRTRFFHIVDGQIAMDTVESLRKAQS